MVESERRHQRMPSLPQAVWALAFVIAVIVVGIRQKVGMTAPLAMGAMAAACVSLLLGSSWRSVQQGIVQGISQSLAAVCIIILVGMLIGLWIVGGTVPTIIYYGLHLIYPEMFLPVTFVICCITSLATGTSFGTIGTVGLALMSIGLGLGVPSAMTAGAIASGAFFGDKMSPLSDTTNVAPAIAGTDLFKHIGSMLWTTVPAAVISFGLYWFIGRDYGTGQVNWGTVNEIRSTLAGTFSLGAVTLIPAVLVILLSVLRIPALATLTLGICCSGLCAAFSQGLGFKALLAASMHGYSSATGVAMVDKILSRGGIDMMSGTLIMLIGAMAMGGLLEQSRVLSVIIEALMCRVRGALGLILSTIAACYATLGVTGNMMLAIILPGKTFKPVFDRMGIAPEVLSRTLEDAGTLGSVLVPWGIPALFLMGALSVDASFIPYVFLSLISPLFAILYAATGFAFRREARASSAD
ncbi:MAG: Na+/H+ antiporter NhaC [Fretibacterium sp.]